MKLRNIGMTLVKCTGFLDLERARLDHAGIPGDRRFMLLDEHGQPMAAHHHGLFMPLRFGLDPAGPTLSMRYPDGRSAAAPLVLADETITVDLHGLRQLTLRKVLGEWDDLLSAFAGKPTFLHQCEQAGAGIDILPLTLLTTGALAELERRIGAPVDPARFRANLIIDNGDGGVAEDGWDGRLLRVGEAVLKVRSSVPRCIVTQFNPASGENDSEIVRALSGFRAAVPLPDGLFPEYATPGFASYAEVVEPGEVAVGDPVKLA